MTEYNLGHVVGEKGPKGDTGPQGPKGPKGDTGATGPQGPQGLKGDKGDTGPQGPQGEKGDPGTITIDTSLSTTSTNAVQNKAITTAINSKANTSHTHNDLYYTKSEVDNMNLGGGSSGEVNLSNYIRKSSTSGLVKNDGSIDTTSYLSSLPNHTHKKSEITDFPVIPDVSNYIQKSPITGFVKNDGSIDSIPKGDKGDTGPQGPKGDAFTFEDFTPEQLASLKGPKGDKGDAGAKGDTGAQGPQGEKGDTGPAGPKGDTGPQGLKGDKGDIGPQGPQGDTGPQGEKGPKGDKGDTGPQGPQGLKGEKGDTGPAGPKGDTGDIGPQGQKGDAFTFEDFTPEQLASLKGQKGDIGPQGPQGPKGEKGDKGDPGTITIDTTLSTTSTNAVQNKAITTAINSKANTTHTHTTSEITDFPVIPDVSNYIQKSSTTGFIKNDGSIDSNEYVTSQELYENIPINYVVTSTDNTSTEDVSTFIVGKEYYFVIRAFQGSSEVPADGIRCEIDNSGTIEDLISVNSDDNLSAKFKFTPTEQKGYILKVYSDALTPVETNPSGTPEATLNDTLVATYTFDAIIDTDWQEVTFKKGYTRYGEASSVYIRRKGNLVELIGVWKTTSEQNASYDYVAFASIPDELKPTRTVNTVCFGQGKSTYMLTVSGNTLYWSRYGVNTNDSLKTGSFGHVHCMWTI